MHRVDEPHHRVDEELRPATVGAPGVGHGQGPRQVRRLIDELVGDIAAGVSLDGLPLAAGSSRRRTPSHTHTDGPE